MLVWPIFALLLSASCLSHQSLNHVVCFPYAVCAAPMGVIAALSLVKCDCENSNFLLYRGRTVMFAVISLFIVYKVLSPNISKRIDSNSVQYIQLILQRPSIVSVEGGWGRGGCAR